MILSTADQDAIERELCSRSLAEFAKKAWPILEPTKPLVWGWALDGMCEHLEAVTRGDINRLLMTVPPGMMKSLLVAVIWPAWEWGPAKMPHLRVMGTAHAQNLAVRDSTKCRRLIQSLWYQKHWPTNLVIDQNTKTKFENDKTGFREAMAFTSLTGSRGDRILLDDPLSADAANSDADRLKAEISFRETLHTRINDEASAIVVIMQRLHARDIAGIILDEGFPYEHFCLPMEYDPKEVSPPTSLGFEDPRTEPEELLFPERFSRTSVDELKKTLGSYASAGQLQQRPAPRGGGLFKDEWWQVIDACPPLIWRGIYVDTAQKTKDQHDYSVLECWGKTRGGQAILIDMVRGKWEAPELLTQSRAFWAKHKELIPMAPLRKMMIEDKVSGTGLIQTLRKESLPVIPVQRNRDKITRAMDVAPLIESGNVFLLNGPWLSDFLKEASTFPVGANDDQLDPMMDAVGDILGTTAKTPRLRAL